MAIKVFQPGEEPAKKEAKTSEHATSETSHHAPHHAHHEPSLSSAEKLSMLLVAIVALVILFNQLQILQVNALMTTGTGPVVSGAIASKGSGGAKLAASDDVVNSVIKELIPTGTPEEYGAELGVSFDDPVAGLATLAKLDRAIPTTSLTPEQKERYIAVTSHISCEFCCSAPAVTDANGRDLCGCSHSAAFRGLTKYLVTQHPDTWTNDQIYWDLTRWKSMFYPKNMVEKGVALVNNGLELTAASLNDNQLLQKLQAGNTDVGGSLDSLPNMVGGC
ncbi:hypothetical protein HY492_01010 [Candidatus Woesearchaeota archaeon]|nr:hypothetical protein [Candidatus Woesearchaeota archaeon]